MKMEKCIKKIYLKLYECEIRTITKEEMRKIEALEIWCFKRIQKISWTDKITNKDILERVLEKRSQWKSKKKKGEMN